MNSSNMKLKDAVSSLRQVFHPPYNLPMFCSTARSIYGVPA